MNGALEGKEAPDFNRVHIPDPKKPKDRDKGRGDDGKGDDGFIGGLINGGNGNGGGDGGNGGDGGQPDPGFTFPEGFIQGPGNGPGGRD